MQAVIVEGKTKASFTNAPRPELADGQVLVKVLAVALNPTDWKHLDFFGVEGTTLGSDFVGIVEEKTHNSKINEGRSINVGDRVAGCVHGGYFKGEGAFAQYVAAYPSALVTVPEAMPTHLAAGLGVAGFTALFGMFQEKHLGLPIPEKLDRPPVDPNYKILVWSAASSVGQFVVQLARMLGMYVIVTASAKHDKWLRGLGASELYDYNDDKTPVNITSKHPDIKYAFDTYSMNGIQAKVAECLSKDEGGRIVSLLPFDQSIVSKVNSKIHSTCMMLYSAYGQAIDLFGIKLDDKYCQEDAEFLRQMGNGPDGLFYRILESGLVQPNRTRVEEGGLNGVLSGLDDMRNNRVSGEKLVYKVTEP